MGKANCHLQHLSWPGNPYKSSGKNFLTKQEALTG